MVTPERRPPASVDVRASAKINLHLGVGAAREDGFHPLETVYQAIGLHDELVATEDTVLRVVTHGAAYVDVNGVPVGEDNIVARATALMAARVGRDPVADFLVHKEIPVAGGTVKADGVLDFRGTLAVDKEAPVGFTSINLAFELDTEADDEQLETLIRLTERFCVVFQTLNQRPELTVTRTRAD